MRKLVVTEYITLDGIFEEPGTWSMDFWSDEAGKYKYNELFASDIQLLGRLTYEGFAKAWPTMEGVGDFGVKMNTMPKYVISKTLKNADWENSHIIKDNILEEIKKLKREDGKDILVAGSGQLVTFLLENKLVDEMHVLLHPLVLGKGKRLFTKEDRFVFELTKTKELPKGIVALHYKPQN